MERLLDEEVSAVEAICRVIEDSGIDLVFGLPGGDIMALFDALCDHRDTIRTVLVRDEAQAATMAEAYGRLTGKPAAMIAQGAWVLAKAGAGVLEALTGSSPMLILTDLSDKTPFSHLSPTQTGTGDYGVWDARASFRGFMKEVMEARHPDQAVHMTQLAIRRATAGCPGPVALIYHGAALNGRVGPDSTLPLFATRGYQQPLHMVPREAELREAAALINGAARPVIIAGNGVRLSKATAPLMELAERISAPIVTSSHGKGVVAETHMLAGGVMGDFGIEAANRLVAEADLILAVGTRLAPGDTVRHHSALIDPRRQKIVQIDSEPRHVGWSLPVDCGLAGDARATLELLLSHLAPQPHAHRADGRERVRTTLAEGGFQGPESFSNALPMLPQRVVEILCDLIPDDAIVAADAGENRIFLVHHYRTKSPGGFLQPGSTGGMGYAIPAAMAARLAHPDRPAIAVLGDGGFAMSVAGLMTARENDLPLIAIVMNNGILGWVQHVQGNRIIASTLGDYDHAAIARTLGWDGIRVETEAQLREAFATAIDSKSSTLIDVVVSGDESWEKVASSRRLTPR
jgi:acetolactate synthase-1/2/3 large subunit